MSAYPMPELLSIHGRCPRCSQVLTLPAGQLQGVFRCARCQYRVLGSVLVDEARALPPRPAAAAPVLRPFAEDSEDQQTRVHVPGTDEQSEVPLAAVVVTAAPSAPPRHELQRFDADSDDDQQTRLHVAGSFDSPPPAPSPVALPAPRSAAPPPPRSAAPPARSAAPPARSAAPPAPSRGAAAAALSRFDAEAEDQATRLHLPDTSDAARPAAELPATRTAPTAVAPVVQTAGLTRFDRVEEDAEDQQTRLQVPLSYEDEAPAAAPALRPLVASRRLSAEWPDADADIFPPRTSQRFGRAALQFTRWIDDWVRERHAALLATLALLCAVVAPLLDALFGSTRRAATVIAANLVLFFLWTLVFAWLGKVRNDEGVWDPRVAWTRLQTGSRLAFGDLGRFGALPWPLKWRVVSELSGVLGLAGLGLASALTVTQLVYGSPETSQGLIVGRALSGMLVLLSVVASRQARSVPLGFVGSDVTAPAVAHLPAVVDVSLPLSLDPSHAATPVHQLLEVLSQWPPEEWRNRDSYLLALERHLMRSMGWARIERDRPLGTERREGVAPLIVNDSVLLEAVKGFDGETAARVTSKMRALAKVWRGKPAIIVIFDASRAELLGSDAAAPLEALHQSYPMLAVRMPSARASLA